MPETTFTSGFHQLIVSWLVGQTVEDVERELVVRTLAHHRGNRTRAARDLKISIRTLRNKIKSTNPRELPCRRPVTTHSLAAAAGVDRRGFGCSYRRASTT